MQRITANSEIEKVIKTKIGQSITEHSWALIEILTDTAKEKEQWKTTKN